ncbi:MAG: asparaginase [Planctomycetota bacterium]|jgi:L-asparaginase|nr:asparaginase [Planctomycetota bacterium]
MPQRQLPMIALLATGGTIAGISTSGGGYLPGVRPAEELLDAAPEIASLARLRVRKIAAIGSEHMTDAIWLRLAAAVNAELADRSISGIVILHGTDTMEETACFLDLAFLPGKPVVLTGAMLPPDRPGADGPANIRSAIRVAAGARAQRRGVLVVMNGLVHRARDVIKADTAGLNAFHSPFPASIGRLAGKGPVPSWVDFPRPFRNGLRLAGISSLPRVEIVYGHAGERRDLIDAAVRAGAAGLVHAGVGAGMIHRDARPALSEAIAAGVVVVRASRVWRGAVAESAADEDRDLASGLVPAGGLNPQKARVLLQLGLIGTKKPHRIRDFFRAYTAGIGHGGAG